MSQITPQSHVQSENGTGHHSHALPAPGGLKEANREWFDNQAHKGGYEAQPVAQDMSRKATAAMLEAFSFDKNQTVVMDFASGTGMISQNLAPYSKKIIGVDISSKSVDFYNERVVKQGISSEEMKAVCVDLIERGKAENDVLTELSSMSLCGAYHHFGDIKDMTKILISYLKPDTGTLIIVDIIASPEAAHLLSSHGHIVSHTSGFNEELIRSAFVNAGGLREFSFKPAFQLNWHGKDVGLFVAKGIRPGLYSR